MVRSPATAQLTQLASARPRWGWAMPAEPMATLDPDMGSQVHRAMEAIGIDVRTRVRLDGFETDEDGRVTAVVTDAGSFQADLVVLGTGVAPETTLAREAGLLLGRWGGLVTDLQMRVFDADGVSLRYAYWPRPAARTRGTVCVFPGRTEKIEKYFETAEDLRGRGFAVAVLDWRGQGGSQRLLRNPMQVHGGQFSD